MDASWLLAIELKTIWCPRLHLHGRRNLDFEVEFENFLPRGDLLLLKLSPELCVTWLSTYQQSPCVIRLSVVPIVLQRHAIKILKRVW